MKRVILLFSIFLQTVLWAQDLSISGTANIMGVVSSEDNMPFWMYTNTNNQLGAGSNFSALAGAYGEYRFSSSTLEGAVSLMYRDDVPEEFQRKDLFLRFSNKWLQVTLGSRSPDLELNGLSATNKNFLWSNNIRPLPGLVIEANNPLRISNTLGLDWGIGHYNMFDDRFVEDVWVHYKRLGLEININENHRIYGRIQHFAQWGGTSPQFGNLPDDFNAFLDVFFASRAKEINVDGEIENAVGNHLGSYFVEYNFVSSIGLFGFYHDHPFEDGSGTALKNFPDGVWGLTFQPQNNGVISAVVYEYIDTTDQSLQTGGGRADNYFSNNVYRSGWTFERNVVGMPFIMADPTRVVTEENRLIVNNRVQVHHFGLGGTVHGIGWKFKTSISKNLGTFKEPFPEPVNNWYNLLALTYHTQRYGTFVLQGGADFNEFTDDVFGGALGYRYSF